MGDRLSALDASFLYAEEPTTPMHVGAVGVTSYDGGVYYGLNADRDAMSDVDTLAALLEELVSTVRGQ